MTRGIKLLLIGLLIFTQWRLWVGESSFAHVWSLQNKIKLQQGRNRLLTKKNKLLEQQILALKNNPTLMAEYARQQLGFIKQGEVFYTLKTQEK